MKCEYCNKRINKRKVCLIRTKEVCKKCFEMLKKDNLNRFRSKKEIPKNLKISDETKQSLMLFGR
ncbi:MAG TPA: hypothetical protein VGB37_12675 [Candidatus Lokiarchaeia archaeon]